MEAAALKKLHPELFQRRFMEQETRPDGRSFHESRSVTVAMHAVSTADGSCVSKVGDTSVAAGIQLVSYEPMEGTETKGDFTLNVSLYPLEPSRTKKTPEEDAIAHRIRNIVLRTKALSLESLHDVGGKSNIAWRLKCDAFVLCSDGNVFDALLLAVVGALQSVAVPRVKSMKDGSQPVIEEGDTERLRMDTLVPVSFARVCGKTIVDPTADEEALAASNIHVVFNDKKEVVACIVDGGAALEESMVAACVSLAQKRSETLLTAFKRKPQH